MRRHPNPTGSGGEARPCRFTTTSLAKLSSNRGDIGFLAISGKYAMTRNAFFLLLLFAAAGTSTAHAASQGQRKASEKPTRVSLSPRFAPGQSFLYEMQFQNDTASSRTGFAADPQGPSKLTITWDTTISLDVEPGEATLPGSYRLRISYDKSSADVQSDSFDPEAARAMI